MIEATVRPEAQLLTVLSVPGAKELPGGFKDEVQQRV